jgi:SPP1 gp7 family putative phage head morphogenesis protein
LKFLKPIAIPDAWWQALRKIIATTFAEAVYAPLQATLEDAELSNAKLTPLTAAIKAGDVVFSGGFFTGKFNAKVGAEIKKLGGKWDAKRKGYAISATRLPAAIFQAATRANDAYRKMIESLQDKVAEMPKRVADYVQGIDLAPEAERLASRLDAGMRETVAETLGVQPEITPAMREKIKAEYSENVRLSIVNFSQDEAEHLRVAIMASVKAGRPRSSLVDVVQGRLAISRQRAKFIARQETMLFTGTLKKTQYENVGIDRYQWQSIGGRAGDGRTRKAHRDAHGKIFYFDQSKNANPVRNAKGEPVHPQVDWNCRCVCRPVVEVIR